jgi:hypothetical protein
LSQKGQQSLQGKRINFGELLEAIVTHYEMTAGLVMTAKMLTCSNKRVLPVHNSPKQF